MDGEKTENEHKEEESERKDEEIIGMKEKRLSQF